MAQRTSMTSRPLGTNVVAELSPTQDSDGQTVVNAVIETPQGSRNKYKYEESIRLFTLSKVLPAGSQFPFSFGFIPRTLGEDGDPLDVLVLADEPVPVGCVVPARLIGVLEAEQGEGKETVRNDRLIAVASESGDHADLKSFKNINSNLLKEMEHFFVSYHELSGKMFKILKCRGPAGAKKALRAGEQLYRKHHSRGGRNGKKN